MSFESARAVLELVYFVSAPVLAVLAGVGLRQIKVARDTAKMHARREALSIAAQQCDHYLTDIIPLQNRLDDAIEAKGITYLEAAKVSVDHEGVRVNFNWPPDFLDQVQRIMPDLMPVLNSMEAFSVFFVSGAADEQVAFSSVGVPFCDSTRPLLPDIVPYLEAGYFRNLFKLFMIWNTRIESDKLLQQRDELEKLLAQVDGKFIRPTGA